MRRQRTHGPGLEQASDRAPTDDRRMQRLTHTRKRDAEEQTQEPAEEKVGANTARPWFGRHGRGLDGLYLRKRRAVAKKPPAHGLEVALSLEGGAVALSRQLA